MGRGYWYFIALFEQKILFSLLFGLLGGGHWNNNDFDQKFTSISNQGRLLLWGIRHIHRFFWSAHFKPKKKKKREGIYFMNGALLLTCFNDECEASIFLDMSKWEWELGDFFLYFCRPKQKVKDQKRYLDIARKRERDGFGVMDEGMIEERIGIQVAKDWNVYIFNCVVQDKNIFLISEFWVLFLIWYLDFSKCYISIFNDLVSFSFSL